MCSDLKEFEHYIAIDGYCGWPNLTLLDDGSGGPGFAADEPPPLGDVLSEGRLLAGPAASRLPIRA